MKRGLFGILLGFAGALLQPVWAAEAAMRPSAASKSCGSKCGVKSRTSLPAGVRSMSDTPNEETYSPEETERRAAAALKRMLQTPHKPHASLSKKNRHGLKRAARDDK